MPKLAVKRVRKDGTHQESRLELRSDWPSAGRSNSTRQHFSLEPENCIVPKAEPIRVDKWEDIDPAKAPPAVDYTNSYVVVGEDNWWPLSFNLPDADTMDRAVRRFHETRVQLAKTTGTGADLGSELNNNAFRWILGIALFVVIVIVIVSAAQALGGDDPAATPPPAAAGAQQ